VVSGDYETFIAMQPRLPPSERPQGGRGGREGCTPLDREGVGGIQQLLGGAGEKSSRGEEEGRFGEETTEGKSWSCQANV